MTTYNPGKIVSIPAGADLSSSKYLGVKLNTSSQVIDMAATADICMGILQNEPVTGEAASVALVNGGGISKIYLSGTLAAGALVRADENGQAAADAATNYNIGQLLTGGAVDELGEVILGNITVKA